MLLLAVCLFVLIFQEILNVKPVAPYIFSTFCLLALHDNVNKKRLFGK